MTLKQNNKNKQNKWVHATILLHQIIRYITLMLHNHILNYTKHQTKVYCITQNVYQENYCKLREKNHSDILILGLSTLIRIFDANVFLCR